MPALSGQFAPVAPPAPVALSSGNPAAPQPLRQAQENGPVVDTLQRDSGAQASATNQAGLDIEVIEVVVGETRESGSGAANQRADNAVKQNAEQTGSDDAQTDQEKAANREATRKARNNVLRCISTSTPRGEKIPSDPDLSFEDCLEDILGPDIATEDEVKEFLCGLVTDTEDRLKRQVDRTGNLLIDAAENLISGQVAENLLQKASDILGRVDPGVIGNCLGAQELIAETQSQLQRAKDAVAAAADEAVAPVVSELEEKSQAAQDYVDFADNVETCTEEG